MKTKLAIIGVVSSLTGLQAGSCYSMESNVDVNQEAAEGIMNSPPECPRILDIDQLQTLGHTGSIFINGLNFTGDNVAISGMLPAVSGYLLWMANKVGAASYAWITGGGKIDDATGFVIRCDYKYRTVAEKARGVPHKSFSINHVGDQANKVTKITQEDYGKALAQFNLGEQASPAEVKKAFMKLAMKFHPDKEGGDVEKFKHYSNAFDLIKAFQEQNDIH